MQRRKWKSRLARLRRDCSESHSGMELVEEREDILTKFRSWISITKIVAARATLCFNLRPLNSLPIFFFLPFVGEARNAQLSMTFLKRLFIYFCLSFNLGPLNFLPLFFFLLFVGKTQNARLSMTAAAGFRNSCNRYVYLFNLMY